MNAPANGKYTTNGTPHGVTSLTPHLVVSPAAKALEFYAAAFGALAEAAAPTDHNGTAIAAAANQQSRASEQVSQNSETVSAATRETNEGARQAAIAAAQLSEKAEQLQVLVGSFKVDSRMSGTGGQATAHPRPGTTRPAIRRRAA